MPYFWQLAIRPKLKTQNSIISFGYVNSYAKIFLILYPPLEKSTTRIAIIQVREFRSFVFQILIFVPGAFRFLRCRTHSYQYNCIHSISSSNLKFLGWLSFPLSSTVLATFTYFIKPCKLQYLQYKHGDGFCDDDMNIPECDFDGQDCCR